MSLYLLRLAKTLIVYDLEGTISISEKESHSVIVYFIATIIPIVIVKDFEESRS
jgi:hypothetical protein